MLRSHALMLFAAAVLGAIGCGTGTIVGENGALPGAVGDNGDDGSDDADAAPGPVIVPDAHVAPVTTADAAPEPVVTATFAVDNISRDSTLAIAEASVGYTYWWGHGGLGASKVGTCSGSCPSCSHTGGQGADCSGFVSKAWMLPESMPLVGNDAHPFSTYNFAHETEHWSDISRSDVVMGDAMTYNSNGEGHIFLYEKDDPWGSMWTYEARGCAYGIVHNIRTASSAFIAIRRTGF